MKRPTRGDLVDPNEVQFEKKPWSEKKKDVVGFTFVFVFTVLVLLFVYWRHVVLRSH